MKFHPFIIFKIIMLLSLGSCNKEQPNSEISISDITIGGEEFRRSFREVSLVNPRYDPSGTYLTHSNDWDGDKINIGINKPTNDPSTRLFDIQLNGTYLDVLCEQKQVAYTESINANRDSVRVRNANSFYSDFDQTTETYDSLYVVPKLYSQGDKLNIEGSKHWEVTGQIFLDYEHVFQGPNEMIHRHEVFNDWLGVESKYIVVKKMANQFTKEDKLGVIQISISEDTVLTLHSIYVQK